MPTLKGNSIEAIIFRMKNQNYEFLLLKRTEERGGFWQPVTGRIEEDESIEEAVKREIKEEVGISDIIRIIPDVYSFSIEDSGKDEFILGVEVNSDEEISLDKNTYLEHEKSKWCSFEEAINLLKWPGNKEGLNKLNSILTK